MKRIRLLGTVAALCTAVVAVGMPVSPASAAVPSWGSTTDLGAVAGTEFDEAIVVLSADGSKATAIWHGNTSGASAVLTASATIVGNVATWGAATTLSTADESATTPKIALSDDGTKATAVWYGTDKNNTLPLVVWTASATISGNTATWSSVVELSDRTHDARWPEIQLSSDGTKATVVWYRSDGSRNIVQSASATIIGNTATWGATSNLSASGENADYPQIGLSDDGTKATVVWNRFDGSTKVVQSASATISDNTATWGSVTNLSASGQKAQDQQVAVSSDGTKATAIWYRSNSDGVYVIQSASATISGNTATWGGTTDLTGATDDGTAPEIALSSDGTKATAVWMRTLEGLDRAQSASATISGNSANWGATSLLNASGRAFYPVIALAASGTSALVMWYRMDTGIVQAAWATVTGNTATWGSATDLTPAGSSASYPSVAMSSSGTKATAVWQIYPEAGNQRVQSASYGAEDDDGGTLPPTGSSGATLIPLALVMLAVGAALVAARRRNCAV